MLLQRYFPIIVRATAAFVLCSFRQRMIKLGGAKMSVFSVAQKYLPGELLGRIRMVKSGIRKKQKRTRKASVQDG
jgi:hypothetical protein